MNSEYQYVKVKSEEIYKWNQVNIKFDNFTQGYRINTTVDGVGQLYELSL